MTLTVPLVTLAGSLSSAKKPHATKAVFALRHPEHIRHESVGDAIQEAMGEHGITHLLFDMRAVRDEHFPNIVGEIEAMVPFRVTLVYWGNGAQNLAVRYGLDVPTYESLEGALGHNV